MLPSGRLGLHDADPNPTQAHLTAGPTHPHTHGTIALGHLFLVLNPGFMVQGHSIAPLHAWIWEPLHCLDLGASLSP